MAYLICDNDESVFAIDVNSLPSSVLVLNSYYNIHHLLVKGTTRCVNISGVILS